MKTAEERKKAFAVLAATLHPAKHRRAVVVAEFLGISVQTVRIYFSASKKAPSALMLECFKMKLRGNK